jgi:hypothetical protein
MDKEARLHSVRRTSPKGEGQKFVGVCVLCGQQGLTLSDMNQECPNQRGLSQRDALIEAVTGRPKDS